MALTVAVTRHTREGNRNTKYGTITFDSSYPTGGEAVTAADFGLETLESLICEVGPAGHAVSYARDTGKLLAWNGTTQVTNTTDLSALVTYFRAQGI